MNILILVLFTIIIIVIINNNKEKFNINTEKVDNLYHNMKTGDLLLIGDEKKISTIRVIMRNEEDDVKYIEGDEDNVGHLDLYNINHLIKKYNKKNMKIKWVPLKEELHNDLLLKLQKTYRSFYTNKFDVDMNCVFIADVKKRYFFDCPIYIIKLLSDINVLKFNNPNCINDPSECLQQFYKNSGYINGDIFYNIDDSYYLT